MRRLLIALVIVLAAAGTAFGHGGGFRVNVGFPLFFPFIYPATYGYYQPPPRQVYYYRPYTPSTVVERVYENGYLVERRVRVYDSRYGYDGRYDRFGGYYR